MDAAATATAGAPSCAPRDAPPLLGRRPAAFGRAAPACAVALICAIDLAWNGQAGLSFTGWSKPLAAAALLGALGLFYSVVRPRPPLAEAAFCCALWVVFSLGGAVMSYLAATAGLPLSDAAFVRFDEAIGFDWAAWVSLVRSLPALNAALRVAYDSLLLQILGSLFLFAFAGVRGRNEELLLHASVAVLLTSATAALLPALGPWVHFGQGALVPEDTAYVQHTLALRQGHALVFALDGMQGIVCFPSFHTTLAVLFTYAHRGVRWSLPPVAVLNGAMLLSIPSEGGHYLADVLAGAAVALAAIATVRAARRRTASPAMAAGSAQPSS